MRFSLIIPARHRVPLLLLFGLALLYWSRVLFTGQVLLPGGFLRGFAPFGSDPNAPWTILQWDALGQYYPWRTFAARQLHEGIWPLWNPYQFCGAPFIANGQSAVFYPLNFVFWILDPAYAFGVSAFLHTLLAACGTYFLAQNYKLSRAAALLSAVAFGFCGYLAAWILLPTLANTAAWLPLLLAAGGWRLEAGTQTENLVGATYSSPRSGDSLPQPPISSLQPLFLACALLAGHPQIFFFILLALGLQTLFAPQKLRAIGQLIFSAALAGVLGAIQLLPMLELAKLGHRAGTLPSVDGWNGIAERALYWPELTSLFLPDRFLHQGTLNENFGYVGTGVCLLALCAFIFHKQIPQKLPLLFALALMLVGLLYALATPLPQLLYWTVPGLSQMGGVGRALFISSLGLALLAGFGLDALRCKIKSPIVPILALIIVTAELFAFGWSFQPAAPREAIYPNTKVTQFLKENLKNQERVWLITPRNGWLPAEILQQNQINHPSGVLPPNGAMVYGLHDINGYDSLAPRAYREWLQPFGVTVSPDFNGNMILLNDLPAKALDAMNVRYVVSLRPRDEKGESLVLNEENCFVYARNIADVPRAGPFYPGWKDGQYQPETFRFGAFLSLCGLSFLAFTCKSRSMRRP